MIYDFYLNVFNVLLNKTKIKKLRKKDKDAFEYSGFMKEKDTRFRQISP